MFPRARFPILIALSILGTAFLLWARQDALRLYAFGATTTHPIQSIHPEDSPIKQAWVDLALDARVELPWDPTPVAQLCAETKFWPNDLYYNCWDSQGGIGNVRQDILSCLRYAIDSGAGLMMPLITVRHNITSLNTNDKVGMDYLFDRELFVARLHEACPKMHIVEDYTELERMAPVHTTIIAPRDIQGESNNTITSCNAEIQRTRGLPGTITVVQFLITLSYYPVCRDPEPFVNQFGNIVTLRQDVYVLAASALYELTEHYKLVLNPSEPINSGSFLGAHLRTSKDAIEAGWPDYYNQSSRYLSAAQREDTQVLFVASGNQTSIDMLRNDAAKLDPPIDIVTKYDLLSKSELDMLATLSWDQQALVDLLILEKSSMFCGLSESSFSWSLAVRRRVWSQRGSCATPFNDLPGQVGGKMTVNEMDDVGTTYKDEYTELIGMHTSAWEIAMWP